MQSRKGPRKRSTSKFQSRTFKKPGMGATGAPGTGGASGVKKRRPKFRKPQAKDIKEKVLEETRKNYLSNAELEAFEYIKIDFMEESEPALKELHSEDLVNTLFTGFSEFYDR